jgi:uncharacterized repeat protein (TIGR03847 family)
MARSFDLDPVDGLGVGTEGPPGRRQFFLRARRGPESVILHCEKFHVQTLVLRIRQMLEAQELDPEVTAGPPPPPESPGDAEWSIGELGLGYHESRRMFVIVARQHSPSAEGDESSQTSSDPSDLATARFWASPEQLALFARQAEAVIAAGRPACPFCGLPIDPDGHPCPAANGSRPIV